MMREIIENSELNMMKTIEILKKEFASLRAGRATPSLLDRINVDYYGTPTPITQLATVSVPEGRLLVIQPWDKGVIADIERAIMKSDLGITPASDGNVIRLAVPQLTEERRKELVKFIKKKGEEGKVAIRNVRRDAMEQLKAAEKNAGYSEDDLKRYQEEAQKLTDRYVKEIDKVVAEKEKEVMEI
ncbi:MAG: ribosome recycling factor [Eubacteriales bacterium]|nr:ribosome recycling factor [Bacillota bacterium]MBV1728306.1 ribosome recycling factor [Desulforudis sp.]MDZ4042665.1 ribosome recycling factor [Eubacteriales bacterium]MBU4533918.1 ribosome recycling factor [Bacillota bacterium]MBU4553560.1 ribosome recycling factor [Bacillota bacterium]